jgi:hypothetical protein
MTARIDEYFDRIERQWLLSPVVAFVERALQPDERSPQEEA